MIQTQPQWSKVSCLREQCDGKALPRLTKPEVSINFHCSVTMPLLTPNGATTQMTL